MPTSNKTISNLANIIITEIGRDKAISLLKKLKRVEGNKSFRDTIDRLYEKIKNELQF